MRCTERLRMGVENVSSGTTPLPPPLDGFVVLQFRRLVLAPTTFPPVVEPLFRIRLKFSMHCKPLYHMHCCALFFSRHIFWILCPVWGRGTPFPLVHLLPHLFPPFIFLFLSLASPIFFFCHPFPFYQNSPTPFPGRRS